MKLFFEITSGDRQGSRFEIRDGLSIGRKATDVIIRDAKISSRHASVEERDHGYYLVDSGSSNGLKIEGNRVSEVHLLPGVAVQLGRTHLMVIDIDEVGETPGKPVVGTWQETVAGMIERLEEAFDSNSVASDRLRMFAQPVELLAVAGPQAGQSWTLVYGPRDIGAESLDVRLIEEGIPSVAYQLYQTGDGLMLKTQHTDVIQELHDDDEIVIQNTRLRVKFREL